MTAAAATRPSAPRRFFRRVRAVGAGIAAVSVKELRGRMRGRRAFVVLTIYLLLLGVFAFGIYEFQKRTVTNTVVPGFARPEDLGGFMGDRPFDPGFFSFGQPVAVSAMIGQALFTGLLVLETLLVLVLAPAFTTGAISLEREKQTLEMLVTTPLSSLAMILGKLFSALVYVFLLIVASIPFASLVFAFGGVGPEDLVRAYLFLFALAFGMGAIGLFISALVRRTQVATVLTYVTVLALTLGTGAVFMFWAATSPSRSELGFREDRARGGGPPEALLWLNPLVADADLVCGTSSTGYDTTCSGIAWITRKPYFGNASVTEPIFRGGAGADPAPAPIFRGAAGAAVERFVTVCDPAGCREVVDSSRPAAQAATSGFPRDTFWPRSALAFVVTGVILTLLSTQLVSPTRRIGLLRLRRRAREGDPQVPGASPDRAGPSASGGMPPETSA